MTTTRSDGGAYLQRERALLRELVVLTLRHSNGDLLRFVSPQEVRAHPRVAVRPSDLTLVAAHSSPLQSGARDAIAIASQCGWLYHQIDTFCSHHWMDPPCSVTQALLLRMEEELERYHGQLAHLESFLSTTMTLRTLVLRLTPLHDQLRTLSFLAAVGLRNLRGGKLLSALLAHAYDGNARHVRLVRSIVADCSIPWYHRLHQWMQYGVLHDVHSEFFVMERQRRQLETTQDSPMSSGYFTWHQRFVLVDGLIPLPLLTQELAKEILVVGKGIHFVRDCLMDEIDGGIPMDERTSSSEPFKYGFVTLSDLQDNQDESICISTLHQVVTQSSQRIHRHILHSLRNKHQLHTHLLALKRFLFLGQGDFVSSLVESFHQELFRGRTSLAGIYAHSLSSVLEGALRTSNARYLPDVVLARLSVRFLVEDTDSDRYWMGPPKDEAMETVLLPWDDDTEPEEAIQDPWDYICLEYAIDSPLDAIIHTTAMESYQRVFMFLFRLKRVEWMLNHSWRQSTALNHAILIETKAGGADAPHIGAAAEQSSFLLRRISSIRQTMLHFVSNLQNYLMFEVLEGGWERLVQSLNHASSLDDVISAHDSYLNEILVKTLLNSNANDTNEVDKGKTLEDLLRRLLSIALKFGKFQDFIFGNVLAALNKSAQTRHIVDETSKSGTWGRKTVDEEEGQVFIYLADSNLSLFVEKTAREFDRVLSSLLKMLKKEVFDDGGDDKDDSQPSLNHDAVRFLLFRLDYSGYYHRQAKARAKKESSSA